MIDLKQPLPSYLVSKKNIIRLVAFTAVFALVFINIYAPFGVETWYRVTRVELFFYSSLVILTGVLVVVVSRIILFYSARRFQLSVFQYGVWVVAEVVFMALFYMTYETLFLHDQRPMEIIFKNSVQNTTLVLMLPYSVLWLYFSWADKQRQILELTGREKPVADSGVSMIGFYDEKDELQLSLKIKDFLYLESSGNYVTVVYVKNEKLGKFLLRNTMKMMEQMLSERGIVRCHRSFMVNFDKVKLMRKEKNGLVLEMDFVSLLEVPVSKTYIERVLVVFSRYAAS